MNSWETEYIDIDEIFEAKYIQPQKMDKLWEKGWRHLGPVFRRYSIRDWSDKIQLVIPLRINLKNFKTSKNHKRIIRQNVDLDLKIKTTILDNERDSLFQLYKTRFTQYIPESLATFLGEHPEKGPCKNLEFGLYKKSHLIAASYLDVGKKAAYSQCAMFHPEESKRSLGTYTMLKEIEYAINHQMDFYYMGYVYNNPSELDYKKNFRGVQGYDWKNGWYDI